MKGKKIYIGIILVAVISVIAIMLCLCAIFDKDKVNVIRSDSWFHEFYIKEDKVFIRCEITLENSSNEDEYVNLLANMQEDVDGGLLKAPIVTGYDETGKSEFFVPAHSKKEYTVLFIGDFAGKDQKRNRDLPSIECVRVKD